MSDIEVSGAQEVAEREAADVGQLAEVARGMIVETPEGFEASMTALQVVVDRKKEIEAKRVEMKKPILEAGKAIDAFFKPVVTMLEDAERVLKSKRQGYRQLVEDQAKAERDRLQKIADAEAKRKAEEEAQAELEEQARQAEAAFDFETAEEIRQQEVEVEPVKAAPVAVVTPVIESSGTTERATWSGEVVDLDAVPDNFKIVSANQKAIDAFARVTKGETPVAGIRWVKTVAEVMKS